MNDMLAHKQPIAVFKIDATAVLVGLLLLLFGLFVGSLIKVFLAGRLTLRLTVLITALVVAVGGVTALGLIFLAQYYSVSVYGHGLSVTDFYGFRRVIDFAAIVTVDKFSLYGFDYAKLTTRDGKVYYLCLFVGGVEQMKALLVDRLGNMHPLAKFLVSN